MIINNYLRKHSTLIFVVILSILSLICFFVIFLTTKNYGVGVSSDSIQYIIAARSILNREPIDITLWPPLYPAILAFFTQLSNIEVLEVARILNATIFSLTIFLSGLLFQRRLNSLLIYKILGTIIVAVSIPLLPVYLMAWSEPLFILFTTLYLVFFELYLQKKKTVYLILLAISIAFCCLTRYIGIVFVFAGATSIIICNRQRIKSKIIDLFCFVSVSLTPLVVWIVRNYLLFGSATGERYPSPYSYIDNINAMLKNMNGWFLPDRFGKSFVLKVSLFLVFCFFVWVYLTYVWKKEKPDLSWQLPYFLYIAFYLIFLVISVTSSTWQIIDNRYLSPVFIPLSILLFSYILLIMKSQEARIGKKKLHFIVIIILCFYINYAISINKEVVQRQINEGKSFTSKSWGESETMEFIKNSMPICTIYSNGWDAIELFTGKSVRSVPRSSYGASEVLTIDSIQNEWPEGEKICIIWFDNITWRDYYFTPEELLQITHLDNVIELNDGFIYYLSKIH